jgi:hypothetical protein
MKGGVLHAIAPASALAIVVALRVHLDDSTHANGPLRVLPARMQAECSPTTTFKGSPRPLLPSRVWLRQAASWRCARSSCTPRRRRVTTSHAASSILSTRRPFTLARASNWPLADKHLQPTTAGARVIGRSLKVAATVFIRCSAGLQACPRRKEPRQTPSSQSRCITPRSLRSPRVLFASEVGPPFVDGHGERPRCRT